MSVINSAMYMQFFNFFQPNAMTKLMNPYRYSLRNPDPMGMNASSTGMNFDTSIFGQQSAGSQPVITEELISTES